MGLSKLNLRPGINTNATPTMNESGWSSCNLVRWKNGFLEKIGGWLRLINAPFAGYIRALHAFEDLQNNLNLVSGSDHGLQIAAASVIYDVSLSVATTVPAVYDSPPAPGCITCTTGSTTYTVTDTQYHPLVGETVLFPVTFSAGGVTFLGGTTATVATLPSSTAWTFIGPAAVNANPGPYPPVFLTAAGSSVVRVAIPQNGANYSIVSGNQFVVQQQLAPDVSTNSVDVPPGSYPITTVYAQNLFDIETGIVQPQSVRALEGLGPRLYQIVYSPTNSSLLGPQQNWFLDNLGENVTISYTNSPIYVWKPPVSMQASASLVLTAPRINAGTFVAMPQAQVIAFGTEPIVGGGEQDPLLIRFSDAGGYSTWNASSTNQAGSYRLSRGSRIVGGLQAPQTTLIWTDTDLWSMQYNGPPFVYGFTIIGTGCGLISPKARASIGGVTYWMGRDGFWQFSGAVAPLNCDVWDVVFNDIDRNQVNKCFAGASSSFQDMYFFYPSLTGGTGEIDSYVKVNFSTGAPLWDYGRLVRTAWIDNNVFGPPMGADGNFRIQQHETGYDADDQPMTGSFAQSGMIDLGEGDEIMSVTQIQPDFKFFGENGSNLITLWTQNYAGDTEVMRGPYPVTPTTRYVSPRARARQMAVRIDLCSTKGASARVGAIRIKTNPAGTRP